MTCFMLRGSFAAYRVSLDRADFEGFSRDKVPSLLDAALAQLAAFKEKNPEVFQRVYQLTDLEMTSSRWEEKLQALSHPYDALLAMVLLQNETQRYEEDVLFEEIKVQTRHLLVGNTSVEHGVPSPADVKAVLVREISNGLSTMSYKVA